MSGWTPLNAETRDADLETYQHVRQHVELVAETTTFILEPWFDYVVSTRLPSGTPTVFEVIWEDVDGERHVRSLPLTLLYLPENEVEAWANAERERREEAEEAAARIRQEVAAQEERQVLQNLMAKYPDEVEKVR